MRGLLACVMTISALAVPSASATIVYPDADYIFEFTGYVTEVLPGEGTSHHEVYYEPFLEVGQAIHAVVGVNYMGQHELYAGMRHGNEVIYWLPTVLYNGGFMRASFETKAGFDPERPDSYIFDFPTGDHESNVVKFDLFTRQPTEISLVSHVSYIEPEFTQISITNENSSIYQKAGENQGSSAPFHSFNFTGTWKTVKFLDVPEPTSWSLLIAGILGAGYLSRRRQAATPH
ncbi:MAG: PEP-CTERM sorting domain-containing protein [Tistlia sp.]|uniref:PEP-CTERM sorting domain-containing protein n=1 Tax=Tistlia sp. TaxID=3057121 RepID=UPI0034A2ED09